MDDAITQSKLLAAGNRAIEESQRQVRQHFEETAATLQEVRSLRSEVAELAEAITGVFAEVAELAKVVAEVLTILSQKT